jgi:hypothetical protein
MFNALKDFMLCSPAQPIKVSSAILLSSTWYENKALQHRML